jgi:hypothetical protein
MGKLSARIDLQLLKFLQKHCEDHSVSHVNILAKAVAYLHVECARLQLAGKDGEGVTEALARLNHQAMRYGAFRDKIRGTKLASFRTNISNETADQLNLLSKFVRGKSPKGRIVGFALGRYLAERGYAPNERNPNRIDDFQLPLTPYSDKWVAPFLGKAKRSSGAWPKKALLPKWARGESVLLDPSFLLVLFAGNYKAKLILWRLLEGAASATVTTAILSTFSANALTVLLQNQNARTVNHPATNDSELSENNWCDFRARLQALLRLGLESFLISPEDFMTAVTLEQQIKASHDPDFIRLGLYKKADFSVLVSLVAVFRQTDKSRVGVLVARTIGGRYKFEWDSYSQKPYREAVKHSLPVE